VVVLTGRGDRAFIAGGDIGHMAGLEPSEGERWVYRGQRVLRRLERLPQVTIAAINGFALGGGLEVALACDLRMAADTARLGVPEVTVGLIPGWGGTQRLARLVGWGTAKDLVFTGRIVTAEEALHLGLVNRVVPGPEPSFSTTANLRLGRRSGLSRPGLPGGFHPVQMLLELADALPDREVPLFAAFPCPVRGLLDEVSGHVLTWIPSGSARARRSATRRRGRSSG
jgi:enoyl-CoA hydratase/carnithine racemase